jgi:hypothetical protein
VFDAAFLNEVANHPEVRPWLGCGDVPLDFSDQAADPRNIVLRGETGVFFLHPLEGGCYEVHSLFLPGSREAPRLAQEGFRYLFAATDCLEVVTKVPAANRRAHGLARWVGFTETFAFVWEGAPCSYRSLTFERWKERSGPGDAHAKALWAFRLMVEAHNAAKAVWTYNRWARFVGYPLFSIPAQGVIDMAGTMMDANLMPMGGPTCH